MVAMRSIASRNLPSTSGWGSTWQACSHGCTVSKPSDEQMFYMMQRGLGLGDAESLIVRGFAETSFERISDRELVEKWLGRLFA